jgi:hypothetical protein
MPHENRNIPASRSTAQLNRVLLCKPHPVLKKPVIGFVISPFSFEGKPRIQAARACIQQLETCCNGFA